MVADMSLRHGLALAPAGGRVKGAVAFTAWSRRPADVAHDVAHRREDPHRSNAVRAALRFVVDLGLPPLCPACRAPLGDQGGLCAPCWSRLSFIAPPYCERLGIPFVYDPGPGILSMEAIADPPAYTRARAAVRYDDVARALVHAFKYGDRLDLAPTMGGWMARAGRELLADADAPGAGAAALAAAVGAPLQPVGRPRPGHGREERRAGARRRAAARARDARSRSGCRDRSARAMSRVRSGVPADRRGDVRGRRLVLVDDVLTSGATVDTCARALLRAGAANVDVIVFARVVDSVRAPI